MRRLSYGEAIREAFAQLLSQDPDVFVIGQGVWSPWYVGASMQGLDAEFGTERVIDTPVSESAVTGMAVGAALAGKRPIVVHPRMDFMLLAADPIINEAANWSYMSGGRAAVPLVIRGIINRGGLQAAQHSQALQAFYMHVPGLKVVMPSTPYDAKGLLIAAVMDDNPVMYIDDRWLYDDTGDVPEKPYRVPLGKAAVRREGTDITIVASSFMAREATTAATMLEDERISAEVIDLRSLKPLDIDTIAESVRKTGRVIVADGGWRTCGASAEIASVVGEVAFDRLRAPVVRVALPDCPAPMSAPLEEAYYPRARQIADAVRQAMRAAPSARI